MIKQNVTSEHLLYGLTIFVGFMPLAFTFSPNRTQLLLDTPFRYIVWGGQTIILLILLLSKLRLSRNQLIGLSVLYALIPFAFAFNDHAVNFLILDHYTSSILSWAIAGILFSKWCISTNFKPGH